MSTCSASTSSATWNSTAAAPNCCSRCSPSARRPTPSPSPSNQPFSGWARTFTDPRICAAIIDRLTFAGNILETGTISYRLAHARSATAH
ncbi:ATP-binding protein [Pseudonocardia parietis]|uniref:ATP-binding protein n=1 Tax=Pseudonocardia parietis TaxID=570936 RepID=UPI0027DB738F|nr:ATP-binding protein [Pseudonocardia parietis]